MNRNYKRLLGVARNQFSTVQENAKKDFDLNFQAITRKQAAKRMLLSGNTLILIKNITIETYQKGLANIIEFIKENYNGENNKIYTCYGVRLLKNLAESHFSTLRKMLEEKLHLGFLTPALGKTQHLKAKENVENELKEALNSIDQEMTLKISVTLSYIKHKSWETSWLFKNLSSILISVIASIILALITKRYLS
ncbi:TPA: hypothetical protein ACPSKE_001781 [Legionella feeleii]